tara:strand:- start:1055 stop:1771 length:717 start_codon:yes stop_codon:yes gene_type:complete
MSENVFVLGNGPSRANIDPSKLDGTVIGCNACYRDFNPDVICAIDAGIISEITKSDFDGKCYFTHNSWNLLPAESYDGLKYGLDGNEKETYRRFDDEHFVYISGLDKNCSEGENYIIWLRRGKEDKIRNIGSEVIGWSTGTSALHVACRDFTCDDYEKVYLLGFDHHVDYYANLYTNTEHYFNRDRNMRSEYDRWGEQILQVVKEHPALQFIWVNYLGDTFPKLPNLFSKDEKEICQL